MDLIVPGRLPLGKGVTLLKHHAVGLYALHKPEGVLSHPNADGETTANERVLIEAPYNEERECFLLPREGLPALRLHLLHRLDSPTSGVVLLATEEVLVKAIREAFRNHGIQKTYLALVRGPLRRPQGVWKDQLQKHKVGGAFVRTQTDGDMEAIARFRHLGSTQGSIHLFELKPETGRTHQLRVQCASHGYPILGDRTYGDFKHNAVVRRDFGEKRLFLHAHHVTISVPFRGQTFTFEAKAPVPESFAKVLGAAAKALPR